MCDVNVVLLLAKIQTILDGQTKSTKIRDFCSNLANKLKEVKRQVRYIEYRASNNDDNQARTWLQRVREFVAAVHKVVEDYEIDLAHPRRKFFSPLFSWYFEWKIKRHLAAHSAVYETKVDHIIKEAQLRFAAPSSSSSEAGGGAASSFQKRTIQRQLDGKMEFGLDSATDKLVGWLVDGGEDKLRVMSVVAGAGMGKTTLATKVFRHPRLKGNFHCFAWITVTQQFNLHSVFRRILVQFCESSDQEVPADLFDYNTSLDELTEKLQSFLAKKTFVLVLDDVCSKDVGEFLKFKLANITTKSRILVTTRLMDVAYSCASSYSFVYNHRSMSTSNAFTLFCSTAQLDEEPGFGDELQSMAKEMVFSCLNLPLAIDAVAGLISTVMVEKSEWDPVHRKVKSLLRSNILHNVASMCYDHLPDFLKPPYLYFGMFPEVYSVDKKRLIRLWLAEGFVVDRDVNETEEEAAERYLKELIQRNLVFISDFDADGRVRNCAVHRAFHSFIISKLAETNFGAKSEGHLLKIDEGASRLSIQGFVEYTPAKVKAKHLSSLMLFRVNKWPKSCMRTLFIGSDILKVLDLTNAPLETFPDDIPTLPCLRYLSLRNTKLAMLPSSIGKLTHLITLNIKGTKIAELPSELLYLENLRHLLVHPGSRLDRHGAKIRFNLKNFVRLLRLSLIDVSTRFGIVKDIEKLVNLRRLGITNLSSGEGKDFCSSLDNLSKLESLSISSKNNELINLDALVTTRPLKRLYLHGPVEKIPNWIVECVNVAKIWVILQSMDDQSLGLLGELPNLKVLRLEEAKGKDLPAQLFKVRGFSKLKNLHLCNFVELKELVIEDGAVLELQNLSVQNSQKMEALPIGLQRLYKFRELHLLEMPKELDIRSLIDQSPYDENNILLRPNHSHQESVSIMMVFKKKN